MKTDIRNRIRRYIKHVRGVNKREIYRDATSPKRVKASARVITAVITLPAILGYISFGICPLVLLTGYPCPACGMTRAGLLILKGHFAEAFCMNPFIYAVGILILVFVIYRYLLMKESLEWVKWTMAVMIIGMVIFYVYRMIRYFPDRAPMTYYPNNLTAYLRIFFQRLWEQ